MPGPLCDVPRNITDDQIKAIGQSKGLVGINAFNEFIHVDRDKRDVRLSNKPY